jgi:hypothetical protein
MVESRYFELADDSLQSVWQVNKPVFTLDELMLSHRTFSSKKDIMQNSDNFYLFFKVTRNDIWPRNLDVFQKFKENYPEIEKQLTKTCSSIENYNRLPWDSLLNAYNLMVGLETTKQ